MEFASIIKAVRLCFDEEADNDASFPNATAGDATKMDNIIKAKIGDAMRWLCMYAPTELLSGKDGSVDTNYIEDKSILVSYEIKNTSGSVIGVRFPVDGDFMRLVRVRGNDWHRAVMDPISEDSEEYYQLYDENGAMATYDRPQVALIMSKTKMIEAFPKSTTLQYSYVKDPLANGENYSGETAPNIPTKAQGAFIYYIAYLVLSAYGDARSNRMLEIAMMNLGRKTNTQDDEKR